MTVGNLIKRLQAIVEEYPESAKSQFVVEPHKVWKFYHLYSGFAVRWWHGKSCIVWRQPR